MKITPEFIQQEIEKLGRLIIETKAEVGGNRDQLRSAMQDLLTALQIVGSRLDEATRRADRMADKLIEMAMVNRGEVAAAVSHQRGTPPDPLPLGPANSNLNYDMWGEREDEEPWPPKGYDVIPSP